MKEVYVRPLGRNVSAIGFGCASLGSRISGARGLRALAQSVDGGVNWFDVAPPYGDGVAEDWLGRFLEGRREQMVICSKVGIPRPHVALHKRLLRPLARQAVEMFPGLRGAASRAHAMAARPALRAEDIEPSVRETLKRLRTDYLDVLALHEPPEAEVLDAQVFDVLRGLVKKGMVRALSVAGSPDVIARAMREHPGLEFAQFPETPFTAHAVSLRAVNAATAGTAFVTHGVFGSGTLERVRSLPEATRGALLACAREHGLVDVTELEDVLLAFALANNPEGTVILSMFGEEHIKKNCQIAGNVPAAGFADAIRNVLRTER